MRTTNSAVKPEPTRTLFAAGRLPRTCRQGQHLGPAVDGALFQAAGGVWSGVATCGHCGSTVLRCHIRGAA